MNPILDYYTMTYIAGLLKYPVYHVFEMPSQHSKSLTSFRFSKIPKCLVLAGDTTAQSFRNSINKLYQKGNDTLDLNLIIVEDASKIRVKVRDDFFALIAQFASGIVTVDQFSMDFSVKSHASIVINTPPFFAKQLEKILLNAGSGDRFEHVTTRLSNDAKLELDDAGMYNMPNNINPAPIPDICNVYYPDFVMQKRAQGYKYSGNVLRCKYALYCAGMNENLLEEIHNKEIRKIDFDNFWINQIASK